MEHATESRQRHGNHNAMYFPDEADSDDLSGGGPLNEFERTRKLSDDRLLPASIHIVPPVEAGGNNSTAPLPRGASYARQRSQVDSVGSPSWMSSRGGGGGRWSTADSSNALSPGHTTQQQLQKQRDEDERHMAEVLLPATTLLNNICAEQAPSPTTNEAGRRSAAKHGGVAARKTGRDGEKMDEDATARLVQQALQKASNNSNFASNLQRQREQNLFYIRKHMSSIAQAKESQLEMKDFERVLRKIEEDATTVRRRWRARRVMLPNGAPGIDASMAGFDEDNAGGGAPKMAASFESSSSDDDDDGEHDAPTSRAAIQRARERAARSWAEMQRQLVENPDIGQTLRKEVAGSHDRLKTCRTWRPPAKHSGRHVASANNNNNNSNSTTPRGAQALLTANVPAMPPIDISWGSWPQGSARPARGDAVSVSVGGGGGGGASTAPSGMMVVDASGKASPEALTTVPSGLLTSTMGTDLYGGKITWRSTGTEDSPSDAQIREILALENEVTTRRSNLHTLTPEQKLKMLLKRGNGRSVYNISEVPYRGARQSVAGSTSSAGSSTTTNNNNSNKNATTKRLTNLATATTGASASMLDDSMEMAFQRPPPHPTTTTNTNNNTAEGEAEKMAEGEEVAVVDVGGEDELDEKKGGAASTKLPRLPTAKRRVQFHDEAATAPKSEASDRSTSPEREGAGASPNARPHRGFRPPRKGRDPLPAVYGVGDRSSVLLRQQVLDIRRREMQVEESKAIDVKRTCNLLDRLCPMREVLLEEDVLSAYNNTHPRLWGMKYGKRREDEDEEALLLGQGPLGDGRRSFMEDDAKVWGAHQDGELVCAGTKEEEEAETDDDDADSPTDSNLSSLTGPWGSKQLTNNTGTVLKKKKKKHFFLNANTVLEKHRAEIFRTATRIDDEQRKEARLRYVDILEEVSKQRVSDATWPRAEVALTHARDIIREHPHEQNFFGFKSMVSSFSLVQLVQWPVQEMLQHLAALFRVSGTQYKDWMASLYQRLSNSHDYEARFRAVDRTIKGKEIPNEAHVRITIHNCRRLPREEMQTKRNNTNMNAGDESAPLALTDRPSSAMAFGGEGGESSVGPNSSSSKAPPGAGDSKTVVPQVMSDRTLDEGTTTDNNVVVAPSHDDGVVVPVELPPPSRGTVDERNSTSHDAASPIWNDPEYSIRIKAERQIITSSAVPAGNGPVGNGTSDGVSGIDEANKASSNTAVAKRSVHFYNQTFKLHLYDAASTIHITLLRDGQPIAGGEFSIDRYGTGRRTQLWLPLTTTGMVQGKRTELRLTIEVSL